MSEHPNPATSRSRFGTIVEFLPQLVSGWWKSQADHPEQRVTGSGDNSILTGQIEGKGPYPTAYGGYCDVWKCTWVTHSVPVEVAVKSIRIHGNDGDREGKSKKLRTAIDVWLQLKHDNVVPVFGMTLGFGPLPAVVCPWMKNGTLTRYLEHHHDQITTAIRKGILSQVLSGLSYLHRQGVIHGSLSGSNVFIDDLGRASLADFGMAALLMEFSSETYFSSSIGGAVRWVGPELFEAPDESGNTISFPSTQGDVYSFGCIMLQVLSGKIPYHYFPRDTQVFYAISTGVKPLRPDSSCIDDAQWNVIQQCWSPFEQRPPVEKLLSAVN